MPLDKPTITLYSTDYSKTRTGEPTMSNDYVNVTQVVGAIVSGSLDDDFDTIREAMKQRRDSKAAILKASLKVGDHVKFVSGSPKYLIGLEAIVRNKKQKRLGIEFVDKAAAGRFGHGIVTASPSMIEPMPFSSAPDSTLGIME
jgi:hypothetical protein